MKSSKCLLLLAALVGFGLVGKSNAALLSSIEITSPDSGALVGIDSVITVTATVTDYVGVGNGGVLADSESQIFMYLRTDAGPVSIAFADGSSDLPTMVALNAAWSGSGTSVFSTSGHYKAVAAAAGVGDGNANRGEFSQKVH